MDAHEKDHTTSKKFLAAMEFSRTWSVIILGTLLGTGAAHFTEANSLAAMLGPVLIAEVVVLGFVQVLYLGGQSAIDTFVRVATVIITGKARASATPPEAEASAEAT